MSNSRSIEVQRLSGVFWLGSVVLTFISLFVVLRYDITLLDAEVASTLQKVAQHPGAHVASLAFEILSTVAQVAAAAALYVLLRERNALWATLGSFMLLAGATIIAVHDMGNFALTRIAQEFVAGASQSANLESVAQSMILTAKWGVTVGSLFFSLGIVAYCALLMGSTSARRLGMLGLVAGLLAIVAGPLPWIDPALEQAAYGLYLPVMVWQIVFGIWLIRRKITA
jgi:hypothetical protein